MLHSHLSLQVDRRTKDGKEAYSAFLTASDGKNIISLADYEKAAAFESLCAALAEE